MRKSKAEKAVERMVWFVWTAMADKPVATFLEVDAARAFVREDRYRFVTGPRPVSTLALEMAS